MASKANIANKEARRKQVVLKIEASVWNAAKAKAFAIGKHLNRYVEDAVRAANKAGGKAA